MIGSIYVYFELLNGSPLSTWIPASRRACNIVIRGALRSNIAKTTQLGIGVSDASLSPYKTLFRQHDTKMSQSTVLVMFATQDQFIFRYELRITTIFTNALFTVPSFRVSLLIVFYSKLSTIFGAPLPLVLQ